MSTRLERHTASILLVLSIVINKIITRLNQLTDYVDRLYYRLIYKDSIGVVQFFVMNPEDDHIPHGYIVVQYKADEGKQKLKLGFDVYNKHVAHQGLTHRNILEVRTAAMLEGYQPLWVIYKDNIVNLHRPIPAHEGQRLMSLLNVQA